MVDVDAKEEIDLVEDAKAKVFGRILSLKEPERQSESRSAGPAHPLANHLEEPSRPQRSTSEGVDRSVTPSVAPVTACTGGLEEQLSSIARAQHLLQDKLEGASVALSRMRTHQELIEGTLVSKFSKVFHAIDMLAELTIQLHGRSHLPHRRNVKNIAKGRLSHEAAGILLSYGFQDDVASPQAAGSEDSPGTANDSSSKRQLTNGPEHGSSSGGDSMTSGAIVFGAPSPSQRRPRRRKKVLPNDPDLQEDQPAKVPSLEGRSSPASDVQSVLPSSPQSISEQRPMTGEGSNSLEEILRQNDKRLVEAADSEKDESTASEDGDDEASPGWTPDLSRELAGSKYHKSLEKVPEVIVEDACPWWATLGVRLGVVCLRIAGLEPWTNATKWSRRNRAWRCVPLMLNLLFLASSLVRIAGFGCWEDQLLGGRHALCDGSEVARLFVDVFLGLSSFLVFPSMAVSKCALDELQGNTQTLRTFASKRHFQTAWYRLMSWDFVCFIIALGAAWSERIRGSWAGGTIHRERIHLVLFMASSFTQTLAAYSIICTARGLKCMVDRFLVQLAMSQQYVRFEMRWKVRAALMRRLSSGLDRTFLALGITATMAVLFGIIDVSNGCRMQLLPSGIIFGSVPFIAWGTAGVTDACQKVPPIINALTHSEVNHRARLLLQSVQASEAGVYIGGTKLTRGVVMKSFYFTGMAVFGISTNLFDLKIV